MKQKPQPSAGASSLPSPPTTPTRSPASIAKDNTNRQRSRSTPRRGRNSASNPPLSPEEAHERLLERNRQAATKCREKRKKEFEALSAYVAQLESKHAKLQAAGNSLRNEVTLVKEEVLKHHACGDPTLDAYLHCQASKLPNQFIQNNPQACLSSPAPASVALSQASFSSPPQASYSSPSQASFQSPSEASFQSPSEASFQAPSQFSFQGPQTSYQASFQPLPQAMMTAPPALPSLDASGSSFDSVSPASADSAFTYPDVPVTGAFNGAMLGSLDPPLPAMEDEVSCSDQLPSAMMNPEEFLPGSTNIFDKLFLLDPELCPAA